MAAQAVESAETVNSTGSAGVAQKAWAFSVESMTPVYTMTPKPATPATPSMIGRTPSRAAAKPKVHSQPSTYR